MLHKIYKELTDGKELSIALTYYADNSFTFPDQGDKFFAKFGVGNNYTPFNKFERFYCYEQLLLILNENDNEKFQLMHKGTAYYFLYWLAFETKQYERAVYYLDMAIAEDIRKTLLQIYEEHPEYNGKDEKDIIKEWAHVWTKNPSVTDLIFKHGGSAFTVTRRIKDVFEQQIKRFNSQNIKDNQGNRLYLNMDEWGDRFVIPFISENYENRSIISTLYSYILESQDYINSLTFRNNQDGSIEPFVINLYKGCLVFESLLKYLADKYSYNVKEGKGKPRTLEGFNRVESFTTKYSQFDTIADDWITILSHLNPIDIKNIFSIVAKLRNFTGHDLRRSNIFNNKSDYIRLVNKINDAVFVIISKEFLTNECLT